MYVKLCPECIRFSGEALEMTLSRLDYEQHVVEVEFVDEFGYSRRYAAAGVVNRHSPLLRLLVLCDTINPLI